MPDARYEQSVLGSPIAWSLVKDFVDLSAAVDREQLGAVASTGRLLA